MQQIIDFVTANPEATGVLTTVGFIFNTGVTYLLRSVQSRLALILLLKAIVGALEKATPMAVMLLAIGLQGCAGTFEESRSARHAQNARAVSTSDVKVQLSERCISLSDRDRLEGAFEKAGIVLTSASGLATIPFDGKGERVALIGTTVVIAAGTVALTFLRESDASAFIRECTQ